MENTPPAQVALAWVIAKGMTPIIGVTKVSQVQDAVKAMHIFLTTEASNQMEASAEETGMDTRGSWEAETASRVMNLPLQAFYVFLKENELDNIGVGGILLSDKK